MAITTAAVTGVAGPLYSLGNLKAAVRDVTGPASSTADGDALTAGDFGLNVIVYAPPAVFIATDRDDAVVGHYDITNSKLVFFWGNAGTASVLPQVTGSTDLSDYTSRMIVFGY